jgi:hypothetical protein
LTTIEGELRPFVGLTINYYFQYEFPMLASIIPLLQMEPSTMLRINLPFLTSLLTAVSFILLSSTPTTSAGDPRIHAFIEDAKNWIQTSESVETKTEGDPCNVSPSLGYLRSHLKLILAPPYRLRYKGYYGVRGTYAYPVEVNAKQPLHYFFYVQKVMEPYRSRLAEANAPSTSFCYLENQFSLCHGEGKDRECPYLVDVAVCLPDSETTTQGKCLSCTNLRKMISNGTLIIKGNEETMGYFMDTCKPSRLGPNSAPWRRWTWPPENTTTEVRYFRWFLESSFVLENKKVGDECSASSELSKARTYLDVLMKKHFGSRDHGNVSLTLTIPGMEGAEDERLYEEVKAELMSGKHKEWWEEKLKGTWRWKNTFEEVYCSREEGLVCVEGNCKDCGVEAVRKNEDLEEACYPDEEGHERAKGGEEGSSSEGSTGREGSSESSGAQKDRKLISKFTALFLGVVCSTVMLGSFRWWYRS